jgi:FkbH-like protein
LREAVDRAVRSGNVAEAVDALRVLVASDRNQRTLAFVERTLNGLDTKAHLRPLSVYVLRSVTLEPLGPLLRAHGLAYGLDVRCHFGGYNQFEQELAGRGMLPPAAPDAVIFAGRVEELAPELAFRFIGTGDRRAEILQQLKDRMIGWLDAGQSRWPHAFFLPWNVAEPTHAPLGLGEARGGGQRALIRELNDALASACRDRPSVAGFDLDAVLAAVGRVRAYDTRNMASARLPYSSEALDALARSTARVLSAAFTKRRKCLVLDCDNTLWGGVIGEDGLDGIRLGPDHPGSAYVAFQRAILNLGDRGIIIALASKNNEADVLHVLRDHPFQQLRESHFAAWRINWNDKAASLRELATELNLGLDAFVFVDDSDFECSWIREQLPEVLVVQAPNDPLALVSLIDDLHVFDSLVVTREDLTRGEMYKAESARHRARAASPSVDAFLESLQMRLSVRPASEGNVVRIAQLTQKTNQFNLTTRRYSEADIRGLFGQEGVDLFQVCLADRFGEQGLIGTLITRLVDDVLWVDTFLLSCRVLGRSVEHALVAFLLRHAAARRARSIIGEYIPTAKNAQTAGLYPQFGFSPVRGEGDAIRFERAPHPPAPFPACFTLDIPTEDSA